MSSAYLKQPSNFVLRRMLCISVFSTYSKNISENTEEVGAPMARPLVCKNFFLEIGNNFA